MFNIKTALKTQKAEKLPEEVITYLVNSGNNEKTRALLYCSYEILKKDGVIRVSNLEEICAEVEKYYIAQNDSKDLHLYSLLVKALGKVSSHIMHRIAKKEVYLYDILYLTKHNVPENIAEKLSEESKIVCGIDDIYYHYITEKYRNGMHDEDATANAPTRCTSWLNFFFPYSKIDEYKTADITAILNSKFFQEILKNNFRLVYNDGTQTKYKQWVLNLCQNSCIKDFSKTAEGYLYIEYNNKNDIENYYAPYVKQYIEKYAEQMGYKRRYCDEWLYSYSKVMDYDLSNFEDECIIFSNQPFIKITLNVIDSGYSDYVRLLIQTSSGTETYIDDSGNRQYTYTNNYSSYNFFMYNKTDIYVNRNNQKARPATLSDLVQASRLSDRVAHLISKWLLHIQAEYPFAKDFEKIYHESLKRNKAIIPMQLSDIFAYHSWDEYFATKYKAAKTLNVKYSRHNPIAIYGTLKCFPYLKESELYILLDELEKEPLLVPSHGRNKEKAVNILVSYYAKKLLIEDITYSAKKIMLQDWIEMLISQKEPISLKKTSLRKIEEEHNQLALKIALKNTTKKEKIVKEDGRFAKLREILPESYEWITTNTRLLMETKMQSHCVYSYLPKIKRDGCAIYSVVSSRGERHTIEFVRKGKRFLIKQIQRRFNSGYDESVFDEITELLKKSA